MNRAQLDDASETLESPEGDGTVDPLGKGGDVCEANSVVLVEEVDLFGEFVLTENDTNEHHESSEDVEEEEALVVAHANATDRKDSDEEETNEHLQDERGSENCKK